MINGVTKRIMTHRLKGVFGFLQVLLALALQDHGPLVDGTEAGATAGGSRVNTETAAISFNRVVFPPQIVSFEYFRGIKR